MPASPSGFGNFFLERNINMPPPGYQIPLLGCAPPGAQQQHLAAGVPIAYSGLQGYNFVPYPHHRHVAHMSNGFDLKAASPYHHALLARGGAFYPPYRPGAAEDPGRVAKVATRESTGALKAWLNEHLKNPYPTKGEKIMLAIITKMSLTQVSTWFANARRRLKKENRVSWASKGKSDEEDEGQESDEEEKCHLEEAEEPEEPEDPEDPEPSADRPDDRALDRAAPVDARLELQPRSGDSDGRQLVLVRDIERSEADTHKASALESKETCQKPKIWSLAETATSDTGRKPVDNIYHSAGKLWADWASRNALLVPACYTTHEIL